MAIEIDMDMKRQAKMETDLGQQPKVDGEMDMDKQGGDGKWLDLEK
jgi:hypothetical protein